MRREARYPVFANPQSNGTVKSHSGNPEALPLPQPRSRPLRGQPSACLSLPPCPPPGLRNPIPTSAPELLPLTLVPAIAHPALRLCLSPPPSAKDHVVHPLNTGRSRPYHGQRCQGLPAPGCCCCWPTPRPCVTRVVSSSRGSLVCAAGPIRWQPGRRGASLGHSCRTGAVSPEQLRYYVGGHRWAQVLCLPRLVRSRGRSVGIPSHSMDTAISPLAHMK